MGWPKNGSRKWTQKWTQRWCQKNASEMNQQDCPQMNRKNRSNIYKIFDLKMNPNGPKYGFENGP